MTKAIDAMRPVICNDGWEHTVSDILTLHDYEADGNRLYRHYMDCRESILNNQVPHSGERFAFAEGYHYRGQPVIISEFGGIALPEMITAGVTVIRCIMRKNSCYGSETLHRQSKIFLMYAATVILRSAMYSRK